MREQTHSSKKREIYKKYRGFEIPIKATTQSMNYIYYAKTDYYKYLASGVQAWELLIANSSGLVKNDTVTVIEIDNNGEFTGLASVGTVQFISSEGILTVSGQQNFYYITNINNFTMYTEYIAVMSQSGTSAPSVTELVNTTGVTWSWFRSDVGIYNVATGLVLDYSKVTTLISQPKDVSYIPCLYGIGSDDDFSVASVDSSGDGIDGVLNYVTVSIKIYS